MDLYLHLPVGFHEVRREALYISAVQERRVENPLTAHLVLDVQMCQQLVEANGTESVVLRYLGDGDRLRAVQDGAGVVRERFLADERRFQFAALHFRFHYLLFQFVSSVLADGGKHFRGNPSFEPFGAFQFRGEDERVESAFVDDGHFLVSAKGITFRYPLIFIVYMVCHCFRCILVPQCRSNILSHEISFSTYHASADLPELLAFKNLILHNSFCFVSTTDYTDSHRLFLIFYQ